MHVHHPIVPDTPKISSMLGVYSNRGQLEYVDFKWVSQPKENTESDWALSCPSYIGQSHQRM